MWCPFSLSPATLEQGRGWSGDVEEMLRRKGPEQQFVVAPVVTERNACRDGDLCACLLPRATLAINVFSFFFFTGGVPRVKGLLIFVVCLCRRVPPQGSNGTPTGFML